MFEAHQRLFLFTWSNINLALKQVLWFYQNVRKDFLFFSTSAVTASFSYSIFINNTTRFVTTNIIRQRGNRNKFEHVDFLSAYWCWVDLRFFPVKRKNICKISIKIKSCFQQLNKSIVYLSHKKSFRKKHNFTNLLKIRYNNNNWTEQSLHWFR